MEEINGNSHFENRIVLSYNPILTICLAAEITDNIAACIVAFQHQGDAINEGLFDLGEKIIGAM